MDEQQRKGFDVGDGWYARRSADGSVTVYVPEPGEKTFTAEHWASLVAAVSVGGEGHVSYGSAYRFHVGADEMNRSSVNS